MSVSAIKRPFTTFKGLLLVLGGSMIATAACFVIFTAITDGLPFRKEPLTPWMAAILIDFYINIVVIAVWIIYKESSWISALLWVVLLMCLGSITTCIYVLSQFFKLTLSQESSEDPLYYVFLRPKITKEGMEEKCILTVDVARTLFIGLGYSMLVALICIGGSPFRLEVLTPWMPVALLNSYINVGVFSVWVSYKESSRIVDILWILLFVCFGSIGTCAYIIVQLHHLSAKDPAYLILSSSSNMS